MCRGEIYAHSRSCMQGFGAGKMPVMLWSWPNERDLTMWHIKTFSTRHADTLKTYLTQRNISLSLWWKNINHTYEDPVQYEYNLCSCKDSLYEDKTAVHPSRHNTQWWRRFDVITTLLLRHVFSGWDRLIFTIGIPVLVRERVYTS